MIFSRNNKVVVKLEKGLAYMSNGQFKAAIKNFESAIGSRKGTNLQRDAAAWWLVNVAKYRREWKKKRFGNANLFVYDTEDNNGRAWSDVDIAAVLVTPNTPKMNTYLSKFLGRSLEAIRFQRRYANGRPLRSWRAESGERYTRFTQNSNVKSRLGVR